jgi:hypothetical protein
MKDKMLLRLGRKLMRAGNLRICVVDDQQTYFNENMLAVARAAGFSHIERYYLIDGLRLRKLLDSPPDIIILDIKGITDKSVAKDGFGIAKLMFDQTNAYVVITSAHKWYLHETHKDYDYVIEERFLTAVDFVEELQRITERYLASKVRFWRKVVFRIGLSLAKRALVPSPR